MRVQEQVKRYMSYCPKCGAKTREEMNFCPKCGATLKAEKVAAAAPTTAPAPPTPHVKVEKEEKHEKEEKGEKNEPEKGERYMKRESAFMGPLVGGFVLIFAGLAFYAMLTRMFSWQTVGALFFVAIGVIIIAGAVYAATMAARRHPRT
jgi:ribosomal protein S27AE